MDASILAVFGDGRAAHHVLQSMGRTNDQHKQVKRIVALCDNRYRDALRDMEGETLKLESIDFERMRQDPKELERVISENQVRWMILMPFGDTFQPGQIQTALEAYKRQRGTNVLLISHLGCDSELSPVNQLRQAENMVRQQFPENNCILRCGATLQSLDFFAEEVKQRKAWRLPAGNGKFAPVCLRDDVATCALMIVKDAQMKPDYRNQTFTLTNNAAVDGNALAEMTNSAFREEVRFENISLDEARKNIERHRGRGGEQGRPATQAGERDRLNRHLVSSWEVGEVLNKYQLVAANQMAVVTDHVRRISGKEPMSIQDYLQRHEEHFRPSRRQ